MVSPLFPEPLGDGGRRPSEAPGSRGLKGRAAGRRVRGTTPFSRPSGSGSSGEPGAGLRLALLAHRSEHVPGPGWRRKP